MKIETYMLTGDNKTSAQAIGKMVGIDNIISEVLPQEKEKKYVILVIFVINF